LASTARDGSSALLRAVLGHCDTHGSPDLLRMGLWDRKLCEVTWARSGKCDSCFVRQWLRSTWAAAGERNWAVRPGWPFHAVDPPRVGVCGIPSAINLTGHQWTMHKRHKVRRTLHGWWSCRSERSPEWWYVDLVWTEREAGHPWWNRHLLVLAQRW